VRIQHILFAGVVLVTLVIVIVLVHDYLTEPYPGHNDFMSRWEGARSFVIDKLNPYGEEASLNIQKHIYGRPVIEGEDPGYFAYPLYTVFLIWPLVYMPYAWASAIWMVFLAACLIIALFVLLNLFGWKPGLWLMAGLVLWSLTFYFAARGLILGQVGLLVYLMEIVAVWALFKKRDTLAGIALAVSTVKPQMGFLIVPFLLLWGIHARRWRFLAVSGGVFGGLALASFVLEPSWLVDWINQMLLYPSYTIASPVWILTQMYLGLGNTGEWALLLTLYGLMLWTWYMVLFQGHSERFLWTVSLTLVVTHLVAPRTATPHFVVFMLPLLFYFTELGRRSRRRGSRRVGLALAVLLVVPWVHFVMTVTGEFEHPTVHLPFPFGMLLLLWLTRRVWWQKAPVPTVEQSKEKSISSVGVSGVSA
jgi:hypothetical protein